MTSVKNRKSLEHLQRQCANFARKIEAVDDSGSLQKDFRQFWEEVKSALNLPEGEEGSKRSYESEIAGLKGESEKLREKLSKAKELQDKSLEYFIGLHRAQKLAREMSSAGDVNSLAKTFSEILKDFVSVGEAAFYRIEDGVPLRIYPASVSEEFSRVAALHWDEGVLQWVMEENRPVIVSDMDKPAAESESHGYLLAPLIVHGEELGFYQAVSTKPEQDYSSDELDIVNFLAKQASEILRNILLNSELKSTKDFMESLVETTEDLILSFDREGLIVFANRAIESYGFHPQSVMNQPLSVILDDKHDSPVLNDLPWVSKRVELKLKTSQGKVRHTICTLSALRDAKREFMGCVGVFKDVSDFKKQEERLIEAERLASAVQTAITVNHEINNPLAILVGNIYLLQERMRELKMNDALERLSVMERSCRRISDITRKLQNLQEAVTTDYIEGIKMIDIRPNAKTSDENSR